MNRCMARFAVVVSLLTISGSAWAQARVSVPSRQRAPGRLRLISHHGLAIEAAAGVGMMSIESESAGGLAGHLGVGVYITPRAALSLRVAGGTALSQGARFWQGFVGPSAMVFATERLYVGGGVGLGIGQVQHPSVLNEFRESDLGVGLAVRAGVLFTPEWTHALTLTLEHSMGFHEVSTMQMTGISLGYLLQ